MNKKAKPTANAASAPNVCQSAERVVVEILQRLRPPEEARRHFETARIEVLKGLRALLDARIERRSRAHAKGQQINVD